MWREVEKLRKLRKRRYAVAALFLSIGLFLFNVAIALFFIGFGIPLLTSLTTYLVLSLSGALAFGYGFYLMGMG